MNHWERVFLTNTLAVPFLLPLVIATSPQLRSFDPALSHLGWAAASCVSGVAISLVGWALRDAVSATSNTVVNVCTSFGQLARCGGNLSHNRSDQLVVDVFCRLECSQ